MNLLCKYDIERKRYWGMTPLPCLEQLFHVLLLFHNGGNKTILVVKEFVSYPNCPTQHPHEDCPMYPVSRKRRALADIPFSFLLALECNSNVTSIVKHNSNCLQLFQGQFAMWRSDYEHAGASYDVENRRLFIAIIDRNEAHRYEEVTLIKDDGIK